MGHIFCVKVPNFRCHGNRGRSDVNFNNTSKLLDLENPLLGATSMGLYVLYWLSYGYFCLKISKISLPWQQGQSEVNFSHTVKLLDLENPRLVQHS